MPVSSFMVEAEGLHKETAMKAPVYVGPQGDGSRPDAQRRKT